LLLIHIKFCLKTADTDRSDVTILRKSINDWLPISTCNSDDAMPTSHAIVIADRISDYWKSLYATSRINESKAIFLSAFNMAKEIANALRNWPYSEISKIQLNRLCSVARKMGQSRWHKIREVNDFDIIVTPEAVTSQIKEVDSLIWINPNLPPRSLVPPFSTKEFAAIPLAPNSKQQSEFQEIDLNQAYHALLIAKKSICLVAIDDSPDLLKLSLNKLTEKLEWKNLEDAILHNEIEPNCSIIVNDEISFPRNVRWWGVDQSITVSRKTESFTSLSSLIRKPYEYVLGYLARISEGAVISVTVDNRLKGNLAHKVVELWLKKNPWNGIHIERERIAVWLDKTLPTLIRQLALPLAQPGKHVERLQFQQQMLDAMDALFKALIKARVATAYSELRLEYRSTTEKLEGIIDILCEFDNGDFAVIDMKWGGYDFYREELKANLPLQLATYAYIAQGSRTGKLLDAGYFILNRAELLCNNNNTFPTAVVVESDFKRPLSYTWYQIEKTIGWRRDQLKRGLIEVTQGSAIADEQSLPPDFALPVLEMEKSHQRDQSNTYKKTFKFIDIWRNLTGNIKEQ